MTQTGGRAKKWGYASLVIGALLLLGGIAFMGLGVAVPGGGVGALVGLTVAVGGFVEVATGWFYVQSGDRIESVATSQGNDVEHLMQGLSKLSNAMRIEAVLKVIGFVILVIGNIIARSNL